MNHAQERTQKQDDRHKRNIRRDNPEVKFQRTLIAATFLSLGPVNNSACSTRTQRGATLLVAPRCRKGPPRRRGRRAAPAASGYRTYAPACASAPCSSAARIFFTSSRADSAL